MHPRCALTPTGLQRFAPATPPAFVGDGDLPRRVADAREAAPWAVAHTWTPPQLVAHQDPTGDVRAVPFPQSPARKSPRVTEGRRPVLAGATLPPSAGQALAAPLGNEAAQPSGSLYPSRRSHVVPVVSAEIHDAPERFRLPVHNDSGPGAAGGRRGALARAERRQTHFGRHGGVTHGSTWPSQSSMAGPSNGAQEFTLAQATGGGTAVVDHPRRGRERASTRTTTARTREGSTLSASAPRAPLPPSTTALPQDVSIPQYESTHLVVTYPTPSMHARELAALMGPAVAPPAPATASAVPRSRSGSPVARLLLARSESPRSRTIRRSAACRPPAIPSGALAERPQPRGHANTRLRARSPLTRLLSFGTTDSEAPGAWTTQPAMPPTPRASPSVALPARAEWLVAQAESSSDSYAPQFQDGARDERQPAAEAADVDVAWDASTRIQASSPVHPAPDRHLYAGRIRVRRPTEQNVKKMAEHWDAFFAARSPLGSGLPGSTNPTRTLAAASGGGFTQTQVRGPCGATIAPTQRASCFARAGRRSSLEAVADRSNTQGSSASSIYPLSIHEDARQRATNDSRAANACRKHSAHRTLPHDDRLARLADALFAAVRAWADHDLHVLRVQDDGKHKDLRLRHVLFRRRPLRGEVMRLLGIYGAVGVAAFKKAFPPADGVDVDELLKQYAHRMLRLSKVES
jgi:hypothetical protein